MRSGNARSLQEPEKLKIMREEKQHKIEVHVAGICFRETESGIDVLIAKRSKIKELYPEKWECGGGQVRSGENFEEAIKRKMQGELGINIERAIVFGTYEIDTPNLPQKKIPGIKFVCFFNSYVNSKEPQIDLREFSQWRWQSINELSDLDFIPGVARDIRIGWEFYSKNNNILNN